MTAAESRLTNKKKLLFLLVTAIYSRGKTECCLNSNPHEQYNGPAAGRDQIWLHQLSIYHDPIILQWDSVKIADLIDYLIIKKHSNCLLKYQHQIHCHNTRYASNRPKLNTSTKHGQSEQSTFQFLASFCSDVKRLLTMLSKSGKEQNLLHAQKKSNNLLASSDVK